MEDTERNPHYGPELIAYLVAALDAELMRGSLEDSPHPDIIPDRRPTLQDNLDLLAAMEEEGQADALQSDLDLLAMLEEEGQRLLAEEDA